MGLAGPARLGSGSGSGSGPGGNHRDGSSKDIAAGKDGGSGIEGQNYLISLDRKITRKQEDAVLDKIMKSGAVVRDLFDYRVRFLSCFHCSLGARADALRVQVFKGILFSVGKTGDKGLSAWESTLASLQGVKSVEEDSVVHVAGA